VVGLLEGDHVVLPHAVTGIERIAGGPHPRPDEHAGIQSEVTVTIRPDGAGTELVIRHEKLTRAGAAARHDQGWRGALDQLARMMEAE